MVRLVRFKTPDALGNVMVEPATATSAPGRTVADQGTLICKSCILFIFFNCCGGWMGLDGTMKFHFDVFWPGISPHGTQRTKPSLLEILTLLGKVANGVKRMEYVSSFFRKPLTLRLAKRGTGILGSWCRAVSADPR